jgi:L-amino acid N-acyltransferase YncA
VIRDAQAADAAAILAIYNATIPTTTAAWTEEPESLGAREAWLARQADARNPVLVAELDGHVVGFASYGDFRDASKWPGYRYTVENTVHVAAGHQGAGVGTALMTELIARAASAGKHVMVAAVDAANEGSLRFHERLGFVETARMPHIGFKFGTWLDLVFVQRRVDV